MKPLRWKQNDDKEVKKYLLMSKKSKAGDNRFYPSAKKPLKLY